jgi:hypothetical protein
MYLRSHRPSLFLLTCRIFYFSEYVSEDPLHLCEDERTSSPLIEFEPLPTGPYHVVSDHGQESTLFIHDASLEMENSWAMEIYEALTLESEGKDSIDKHGTSPLIYLRNHACIMPLQS